MQTRRAVVVRPTQHVDPPDRRRSYSADRTGAQGKFAHIQRPHSLRQLIQHARSHPRERGSAGAVRAAPAARLRPRAAPSLHARRCGAPITARAPLRCAPLGPACAAPRMTPSTSRRAAAAARLLVAPPPVTPSAAKHLEDVAPVRPGSLAIRGGHANNPPRQLTVGPLPPEGCKPTSLEPPRRTGRR